jgi:hypothetical protein
MSPISIAIRYNQEPHHGIPGLFRLCLRARLLFKVRQILRFTQGPRRTTNVHEAWGCWSFDPQLAGNISEIGSISYDPHTKRIVGHEFSIQWDDETSVEGHQNHPQNDIRAETQCTPSRTAPKKSPPTKSPSDLDHKLWMASNQNQKTCKLYIQFAELVRASRKSALHKTIRTHMIHPSYICRFLLWQIWQPFSI